MDGLVDLEVETSTYDQMIRLVANDVSLESIDFTQLVEVRKSIGNNAVETLSMIF
jgi:hypothetical protein